MKIYGDIDSIKDSIGKKYKSQIAAIEKHTQQQINSVKQEHKKKLDLHRSHMKTATQAEAKKEYSRILSEQQMKAKRDFEDKREQLIVNLFNEAEKKSEKIAHSKEYIHFVKKNMPENADNMEIFGDSDYYAKDFPELNIDANIVGIKVRIGKLIYDFTLDNALRSRRDTLRYEISKILFSG